MALVKLGGLAQDVRGSLNGNVFSRNRGGAYVRSKVSPVQPVTAASTLSRAIFKAVSQLWPGLTDAQRAAWEAFAAIHPFVNVFGDSITLSGIAMFQALNKRLGHLGEDYLTDPPDSFAVEDLGSVTVVATATSPDIVTLSFTPDRVLGADEVLIVYSTPPLISSAKPQQSDFRLVNNPDGGGYASGFNVGPDMQTRFPDRTWDAGTAQQVRIAALNKTTGAISNPVVVDLDFLAPGT